MKIKRLFPNIILLFLTFVISANFVSSQSIYIVNPFQNSTVQPGKVVIVFEIFNFTIGAEGEQHMHFYVDNDTVPNMFYNRPDCTPEGACVSYQGVHNHMAHWKNASAIILSGLISGKHQIRFILAEANESEITESGVTLFFNISNPPGGVFTLQPIITGINFPVAMVLVPGNMLFYNELQTSATTGSVRIINTTTWKLLPEPFYVFNIGTGGEDRKSVV